MSKKRNRRTEAKIRKIRVSMENGHSTVSDISRDTGIPSSFIYKYNRLGDISITGITRHKKEKIKEEIEEINDVLRTQYIKSKRELIEKTGYSYYHLKSIVPDIYDSLEDGRQHRGPRIKDNRDELILSGRYSISQIAGKLNITRTALYGYMSRNNLLEDFNRARKEIISARKSLPSSLKQSIIKPLADILNEILLIKAGGKGLEDVINIYFSEQHRKDRIIFLKDLINLVKDYERASENGEKISYSKFAENLESLHFVNVGKIFKKLNYPSLFWNFKKVKPAEEVLQNIDRLGRLDYLTLGDIAHLVSVKINAVQRRLKESKQRPKPKYGFSSHPTFTQASMIYEYEDELDVTNEEIAEDIGISLRKVEYALKNKRFYKSKIIRALKIIHPEEEITKPYR